VIFMTAMGPPNLCTRRILPHLAIANHAVPLLHANREDAMHVYVLRDGSFYFGNSMVALDEVPRRIQEQVTGGAERRVYLQADGRAKYGDVKQVLDKVRKAGIGRRLLVGVGFIICGNSDESVVLHIGKVAV